MSETHQADQVHEATPVRLDQARQSGDVPRSRELAGAIHMVGTFVVALLFAGGIARAIGDWTRSQWTPGEESSSLVGSVNVSSVNIEPDAIIAQMQSAIFSFAGLLAPALILMLAVSLLGHWGQTGMIFRPKNLSPGENISGPVRWWKHVFSARAIAIPFLSLPKSAVAFTVAGTGCWFARERIFSLGGLPVEQLTTEISGLVLSIGLQVALVLLMLSLTDYAIQRWSYARRMQMTDQQLRDELRMQNGDPQFRSRRRQTQRELAGSR